MVRSVDDATRAAPAPDALPRHQRKRRDRIVQAAVALLEEREYDQVQMRDVAERAEVALSTLYRYFTSKEHLYAAALAEWSSAPPGRRRRRVGGGTDAERVGRILVGAVRAFGRRPQFLRAEMVLANTQDPNARTLFDQFAHRAVADLTEALADLGPGRAETVVEAGYSVLAMRLQSWARGRCTIDDVEASVRRTVEALLGPTGSADPAGPPRSRPPRTPSPRRAGTAPDRAAPDPEELPPEQRERRDRIVRAALGLLDDREYDQVQMKDVADRAGVALATLYRYFSSKDHLYAAALLAGAEADEARVRSSRWRRPRSDAGRLRAVAGRAVRAVAQRPQLLRTEMVLANSQDANCREAYDQLTTRHVEVMRGALQDAPADRVDAVVETTACVLGLRLQRWAQGRCTIDEVEDAVGRTVDLLLAERAVP